VSAETTQPEQNVGGAAYSCAPSAHICMTSRLAPNHRISRQEVGSPSPKSPRWKKAYWAWRRCRLRHLFGGAVPDLEGYHSLRTSGGGSSYRPVFVSGRVRDRGAISSHSANASQVTPRACAIFKTAGNDGVRRPKPYPCTEAKVRPLFSASFASLRPAASLNSLSLSANVMHHSIPTIGTFFP